MVVEYEKVIVMDLEATCWEDEKPPLDEIQEVIEVGFCLLDPATGEITDKRSILVKPRHSRIGEFCTKLTSIKETDVADAPYFDRACSILKSDYLSLTRPWASYGEFDRKLLASQCQRLGIPYPMSDVHFNIKGLTALFTKTRRAPGMGVMLERFGLKFEGRPHRGVDDAFNAARLLHKMIPEVA